MARGGFRRAKREQTEAAKVESEAAPVASVPEVEDVRPAEVEVRKPAEKRYILQRAAIIHGKVRDAGKEIRREEIADFDERVRIGRIKEA